MTVWEHLVANSTLAEGDGDAWDHLTNPSGTGGGIIINSELLTIVEDPTITLTEFSDKVVIIEDDIIMLVEIDNVITITEEEKDSVDVIC